MLLLLPGWVICVSFSSMCIERVPIVFGKLASMFHSVNQVRVADEPPPKADGIGFSFLHSNRRCLPVVATHSEQRRLLQIWLERCQRQILPQIFLLDTRLQCLLLQPGPVGPSHVFERVYCRPPDICSILLSSPQVEDR